MIYKNDSSAVSNLHLNCRYHLSFLGLSNSIPGNTIPFTKHVYNVKRYISLHIKGRFYTFLPSLSIRNVIAKIFSCELMHKNISFDFYTQKTRNDDRTYNTQTFLLVHTYTQLKKSDISISTRHEHKCKNYIVNGFNGQSAYFNCIFI